MMTAMLWGIDDTKELPEMIPNKITDTMGIIADVNHLKKGEREGIGAAMLAFYKEPEKWVTGAYIKIGYFGKTDADLVYQDEVHGPLIEQVDSSLKNFLTTHSFAFIIPIISYSSDLIKKSNDKKK